PARGVLVADRGDARAGVARRRAQRDGAAEVGTGARHRRRRRRVVDEDGTDRARRLVPGRVGGDDAQVVAAVGERRRVPAHGVGRGGRRPDRRPGAGAGRRWNATEATPEPPVSAELEATVSVPAADVPSAGAVSEPVGATASIWITCERTGSALPTLSNARYLTVAVLPTTKVAM